MAIATETYVQLPTDGSGKKVKVLEVNQILADGTVGAVELQVVVTARPDGQLFDPRDLLEVLSDIRAELAEIKQAINTKGGL